MSERRLGFGSLEVESCHRVSVGGGAPGSGVERVVGLGWTSVGCQAGPTGQSWRCHMAVSYQLVIDCTSPEPLAHFWAEALHYVIAPPPPGFDSWDDWYRSVGVPEVGRVGHPGPGRERQAGRDPGDCRHPGGVRGDWADRVAPWTQGWGEPIRHDPLPVRDAPPTRLPPRSRRGDTRTMGQHRGRP